LPFVASLSLLSHRFHCHRRHHLRVIIVAAVSTVPSPSSLSCCRIIVVAVTVTVVSSFCHCRRQLPVIVVALLLPSPPSLSSMPLSSSPSTSRRHFIVGFIAIARRRGCHVVIDAAVAVVTAAATVDVARCHSTLKGVQWQWSRTAVNLPVCAIAGNFQHGMK